LPETIDTDPTRVRQILANLLSNAIKFTHRGHVELVVRFVSSAPASLCFAVIDTGIGMDRDILERLLQPFTQADMSHTRAHGGTGLGLTISRRLANMLGGSIEVESAPGQGSTFTFTMPTGPLDGVPLIDAGSVPFETDSDATVAAVVPP